MKCYLHSFLMIFSLLIAFPLHVTVAASDINLNSNAAILMDASSGQILFEQNSQKKMYPASLTKIATAMVAIEQGDLEDIVTVSELARAVEGTRVYLEPGEKVRLKKLVQGLIINSGNDAAIAIAEYFDGSVPAFAKRMNQFLADKVGVTNTVFTNPHGLYDPKHVTTAYDLAQITKYAIKNDTFREIFGTKELKWDGQGWKTTLYHHNQLLWRYDGANGGKTGYVDESGNTLVTTAKRGRTELIAVVLNAPSKELAYQDTISLFDEGFASFETKFIPKNKTFVDDKQNQFITTKELFYTIKKGAEAAVSLKEGGILTVTAGDEEILTKNLKKLSKKPEKVLGEPELKTGEPRSRLGGIILISMGLLLFLTAVLVYRKRKQEQKMNV